MDNNAGFSVISFTDGDMGSHCNACPNVAVYKISLKNISVRVCETCALELFEQSKRLLYRKYSIARIATLTALLKEAGEFLTPIAEHDVNLALPDETKVAHFISIKDFNRAAEIRKKIQEALP